MPNLGPGRIPTGWPCWRPAGRRGPSRCCSPKKEDDDWWPAEMVTSLESRTGAGASGSCWRSRAEHGYSVVVLREHSLVVTLTTHKTWTFGYLSPNMIFKVPFSVPENVYDLSYLSLDVIVTYCRQPSIRVTNWPPVARVPNCDCNCL